jgi:hypothetical protein
VDDLESELLIEIGSVLYQPEIDTWNMALAIKEVYVTDLVGPSKKIPKGVTKIIWTYGDASSIRNNHKLQENREVLLQKQKLKETIHECIEWLNSQQEATINTIEEKKKDLIQEISDLKVIVNEAKEELKTITRKMNKNMNMLKHLDIEDDMKKRGLIGYD